MNSFTRDLHYGLRSLLRNPGFAAVAILTLAVGVGVNTAIFSVLRAVVLRDLPYRDAGRVAVMWTRNIRQNLPDGSSYLNFRDWKQRSRQFTQMAAYGRPEFTRGTIGSGSDAERIHTGLVVAGSVGTSERLKYTTVGDAVNTAARLESMDRDVVQETPGRRICRILSTKVRNVTWATASCSIRSAKSVSRAKSRR